MGCGVIMTVLQAKDQIKIQQEVKQRNSNSSQLSSQHLIKKISKNNQHIVSSKSSDDKENCGERKNQKKDFRIGGSVKQYESTKLPEIKEQNYNQIIQEVGKDISNEAGANKESNNISKISASNNLTTSGSQLQTIKQEIPPVKKNTPIIKTREISVKKPITPQTPSQLKSPRRVIKENKVQQLTLKQNQSNLVNQAVSPTKTSSEENQKSNGSMTGKNTLNALPTIRNSTKRESIKVEPLKKMSEKSKNELSSKNIFRNQISKKSIKSKALVPVDSIFLQSVITADKNDKTDELLSDNPSQIRTKRSQITKRVEEVVEFIPQKSRVEVKQQKSPVAAKDSIKNKEPAKTNKKEVKTESSVKKDDKKQQSALKQSETKKNSQNAKKAAEKKAEQDRRIAQAKKRLYQEQKKKLMNESNKLKKVYLPQ